MSASTPTPPWCRHHPRAKPVPSNRNVAWYRRERARWLSIIAVRQRYPKTPFPLNGEPLEAWITRHRLDLDALVPFCNRCNDTEELEFDHDQPRNWRPEKTSRRQRLVNYIREILDGRIKQALCRRCNAAKGYPDGQLELLDAREAERVREEPF